MIRNLLAVIGFLCVVMAGAAGVYATRWHDDDRVARMAVSVRGLDLTSPEGRYLLDRRIDAAVEDVCRDNDDYGYGRFGSRDCRRKARLGAAPQVRRAIDRAYDRRGGYAYVEPAEDDDGYGYDDDPTPIAPEPAYVAPPRPAYVAPAPVLREKHTTITRTALKPRVKWVRDRHGRLVKKVTHRKLVRKTVKQVYTRG